MGAESCGVLSARGRSWAWDVLEVLRSHSVELVSTVPDGGLKELLRLGEGDPGFRVVTLSTEPEGVALGVGAWLGGKRSILMMQSSGVGNCINMLSVPRVCSAPCLMLVTMRGGEDEPNPWQVPMGESTQAVLEAMGVTVLCPDSEAEVGPAVDRAAKTAFGSGDSVAVLVSQRIVGVKDFDRQRRAPSSRESPRRPVE